MKTQSVFSPIDSVWAEIERNLPASQKMLIALALEEIEDMMTVGKGEKICGIARIARYATAGKLATEVIDIITRLAKPDTVPQR